LALLRRAHPANEQVLKSWFIPSPPPDFRSYAAWRFETELETCGPGFKTLEGVKQLHSRLAHRIAGFSKLFGVSDRESDPINRDSNLVCHLKFER